MTMVAEPAAQEVSESRKRTDLLSVRLLPEEAERVRELADVWDCSTAEVLRRAILRELRQI